MNTFLFCMIFLQVGIFLIAGFCMARTLLVGYGNSVESSPAEPDIRPVSSPLPAGRIILTPTELEYFRTYEQVFQTE